MVIWSTEFILLYFFLKKNDIGVNITTFHLLKCVWSALCWRLTDTEASESLAMLVFPVALSSQTQIQRWFLQLFSWSGAFRCSALLDQSDAQSIKLQSPRIPCGSIRTSAPESCLRPPPSKTAAASDRCRSRSLYRPSTGHTSQQ